MAQEREAWRIESPISSNMLPPCGQNWRQAPHCHGPPPSSTEFGGSLQFEHSSGEFRGQDRRDRGASHCGRDAGLRVRQDGEESGRAQCGETRGQNWRDGQPGEPGAGAAPGACWLPAWRERMPGAGTSLAPPRNGSDEL